MPFTKLKQVLVLFIAVVASGVACAVEDTSSFYYGLSVGVGEVELRGSGTFNEDADNGGQLLIGYEVTPQLSTELRLNRLSGDVSSNSAYGFLRFSLPISSYSVPYAMIGAGVTDINAKDADGSKADFDTLGIDEPQIGAAIGVNLFGNETTALNLEVSAYASDDIVLSYYSIGFQHYFGGRK